MNVNVNDPFHFDPQSKDVIDATFMFGGNFGGNHVFGCTGTLINRNTDDGHIGFYFLTARHCVSEKDNQRQTYPY